MDVLPIPPAPMRATGFRFSARSMTFSINSSRPKQALGDGGGDSPCTLGARIRPRFTVGGLEFKPGLCLAGSEVLLIIR